MAEFSQPFSVLSDRGAREGMGSAPVPPVRFETFQASAPGTDIGNVPSFIADDIGASVVYRLPWPGGLLFGNAGSRPSGLSRTNGSGYGNQGGVGCGEIVDWIQGWVPTVAEGIGVPIFSWRGWTTWGFINPTVNLNGEAQGNGALPPILPAGASDPFTTVIISGDAVAELGGSNAVGNLHLVAAVRDRWARYGRMRFMEFVDTAQGTPPDSEINFPFKLGQLEKQFDAGSQALLGTQSNGTKVFANDCGAAFVSHTGCVFMTSSDVGNKTEQIPVDVQNNTADAFRFFPNCFFRRTAYVRRVEGIEDSLGFLKRASPAFPPPIDASQPLAFVQVNRPPTHTRWGFVIDGQYEEAIIAHPPGSDFRKALDIWNNVIVPAINVNERRGASLPMFRVSQPLDPGPLVFGQFGILRELTYIQFAELLQHYDLDNTTPIYSVFNQAGGVG